MEAGRVRHFARARGQRAKTDRIDAAVLVAFGAATMPPPTRPDGPDIELLKALRLRRQTLVHRRMADLCQLKQARAPPIVALIEASPDRLGAEIDALDRRIATLISNSRTLVERARLMRSVPGIGPVSNFDPGRQGVPPAPFDQVLLLVGREDRPGSQRFQKGVHSILSEAGGRDESIAGLYIGG